MLRGSGLNGALFGPRIVSIAFQKRMSRAENERRDLPERTVENEKGVGVVTPRPDSSKYFLFLNYHELLYIYLLVIIILIKLRFNCLVF